MRAHRPIVASLLIAGVLLPGVAMAQQAPISRESRLQIEMTRQQVIVHPLPNPETVAQDAARVAADLEAATRQDNLLHDLTRRAPSRPDLHYDVFTSIQMRNIQRALRR